METPRKRPSKSPHPSHFKITYHSVSFNLTCFSISYEFGAFVFNFFYTFFWCNACTSNRSRYINIHDILRENGEIDQLKYKTNTVVSNHVNSDHVPSFSCHDVWNARQTTSGLNNWSWYFVILNFHSNIYTLAREKYCARI
jgi:hypothetical protein